MDSLTELAGIPQQRESPEKRTEASVAALAGRLFGEASATYGNSTPAQGAHIAKECLTNGIRPADLGEKLLADENIIGGLITRAIKMHERAAQRNPGMARHLPSEEDVAKMMRGILQGTFAEAERMMVLSSDDLEEIIEENEYIRAFKIGDDYDRPKLERFVDKKIEKVKKKAANPDKVGVLSRLRFRRPPQLPEVAAVHIPAQRDVMEHMRVGQ